jgi:hypothetical protein
MRLDELPAHLIDASENVVTARSLVEETEHNVEDLPELVSDDQYPQCYRHATPSGNDYYVIWSVPLCRRDQRLDWRDAERYFLGIGRQALLFEYKLATEPADAPSPGPETAAAATDTAATDPPARLLGDSLKVSLGLHEGVPLQRVTCSETGNKIKVDLPLLVSLAESIDKLKSYLVLEKQASAVLQRRGQRLAEFDLHTNE